MEEQITFEVIDNEVEPFFDELWNAIPEEELLESGNKDIFLGAELYYIVEEFIDRYEEWCAEQEIAPVDIEVFEFDDAVPYCPCEIAAVYYRKICECIDTLTTQDNLSDVLESKSNDAEGKMALLDAAEEMDNQDFATFIACYVDLRITVEKIMDYNYELY